ncbi:UNVERIFIED_CONTAM: Mediator of RNA polymerase II transcription subunit 14 [Siphonaria sp. JEL0065]|nr:Mediator of RNA polymerase II transcription subunit 14 [Siphonaria sp. JEL0065]
MAGDEGSEVPPGMFPLNALVTSLVANTNADLVALADTLPSITNAGDKKAALLKYSLHWRQQWIKALVVVRWLKKVGDLSQLMSILAFLDSQDACFSGAADAMFKVHGEMLMAREPMYDVVTAVDILSVGNFQRLPSVIRKSTIPPAPLTDQQIDETLLKLENSIRMRLLGDEVVPSPFRRNMRFERGCVTFRVENKFQVTLSLDLNTKESFWIVIDLKILVNFVKDDYEGVIGINDYQLQGVLDSATKSLLAADSQPIKDQPNSQLTTPTTVATPIPPKHYPLVSLHDHLDHFVAQLQMEILKTQAFHLARSRWSRQIAFDSSASSSKPNETILKIRYWCGTTGGAIIGTGIRRHFLEIKLVTSKSPSSAVDETMTNESAIIKSNTISGFSSTYTKRSFLVRAYSVLHTTPSDSTTSTTVNTGPEISLLDPTTKQPLEFSLDISLLDIESLLTRVAFTQAQVLATEISGSLTARFQTVRLDLGILGGDGDGKRDPQVTCHYRNEKAVCLTVDTRTGVVKVAFLGDSTDSFSIGGGGLSSLAQLGAVPATEVEKQLVERIKKMEESIHGDWRRTAGLMQHLRFGTYLDQIKLDIVGLGGHGVGVMYLEKLPFEEAVLELVCKAQAGKRPEHVAVLRFTEWDHGFVVLVVGGQGDEGKEKQEAMVVREEGPVYRAWIVMTGDGATANAALRVSIPIKRDNVSSYLNLQRQCAATPQNEERSKRMKKTVDSADVVVESQNALTNQTLWSNMNTDVLSVICSYARKQLSWLTVLSQVDNMALDYSLCFPRQYATTQVPSERLAHINPKISIHPFFFDIERKIQSKSDLNLDPSATEEDKTSKYCFGNIYLGVETGSDGEEKIVGRVRLSNEILPVVDRVQMDSPLASFNLDTSVITLSTPQSELGAKDILRHWKGLAAIAEVASQIRTRKNWFLQHGIEIVSYSVGTLTLRVVAWGLWKKDGDGSVLLRVRWRRFVPDDGLTAAGPASKNETGKARGLDQFVLESVSEDGFVEVLQDEEKKGWIGKLQGVLNDCLDMVVFAKRLHPISTVLKIITETEQRLNSTAEGSEPEIKVQTRSLTWTRVLQGTHGLDFYLFSNGTMIIYDAAAGGADGIVDPKLMPIPKFSKTPGRLPTSLLERFNEILKNITTRPSEIQLKELPHGLLFSQNLVDLVVPIFLRHLDAPSTIAWLYRRVSEKMPNFSTTAKVPELNIVFKNATRTGGWALLDSKWAFKAQSAQTGDLTEKVLGYLKVKFVQASALAVNLREVMLAHMHFLEFPDLVLNEFFRIGNEEARKEILVKTAAGEEKLVPNPVRLAWCLVMPNNPPTTLAHLPKPGEIAFFVDNAVGRISMVFKFMEPDGSHRLLPIHYNYKTRFINIWKAEPNPADLTMEDGSNMFLSHKLDQLAEDSSLSALDKILLKLSKTNITPEKAGPEKIMVLIKMLVNKFAAYKGDLPE